MLTVWTGQSDANFLNASNWSGGAVPTAVDDVVSDAGALLNQPTLQPGDAVTVNSVLLSGGWLFISGTLTATHGVSEDGVFSVLRVESGGVLNGDVDRVSSLSLYNAGTIHGSVVFGPGDGYARLENHGHIEGDVVFESNLSDSLYVFDNEFLNSGTVSGVVRFYRGGVYKSTLAGPSEVLGSAFDERAELDRSTWTGSLVVDLRDGGGGRDIGDGTRLTLFDSIAVVGGLANDSLMGGAASDELRGGEGDDVLRGWGGNDFIDGGAGSDTVVFAEMTENMFVGLDGYGFVSVGVDGSDVDTVIGVENVIAGAGNDNLKGDSEDNRFEGNAGDDFFRGMAGKDWLDGGAGNDTASYTEKMASIFMVLSGSTAATVSVGGVIEDTLLNIENVIGGSGNDFFFGDAQSNVLEGWIGLDVLLGQGGDDVLKGDELDFAFHDERDYLYGGDGEDTLYGGIGDDALFGEAGHDVLVGGAGADYIDGGDGWDYADGGDGHDIFLMGAGNDTVMGHRRNDYFDLGDGDDFADGGGDELAGDNIFLGGHGDDIIYAGGGADYFDAGPGDDFAFGGSGNDVFLGGDGNDAFLPGDGVDVALGGAGDDTYLVSIFDLYQLVVYDFAAGGHDDSVYLFSDTGFSTFEQVQSALTYHPAYYATVLEVTDAAMVWFVGVAASQLTAADFVFA